MRDVPLLAVFLCSIMLLIATCCDLRTRRIPNALTLPAVVIGMVITGLYDGKAAFAAAAVILGIFFVGMTGILGGGDLKLLMALTAFCGVFPMLIATGAASVLILITEGIRWPKETWSAIKSGLCFFTGKTTGEKQGRRVPFAPYLLCGFAVWLIVSIVFC